MSPTGSGSDQPHLLALLRAIRLRHGADDAAAAGAADTEAALFSGFSSGSRPGADPNDRDDPADHIHPEDLVHPSWPSSSAGSVPPSAGELPAPQDHPALPPGYPPTASGLSLPAVPGVSEIPGPHPAGRAWPGDPTTPAGTTPPVRPPVHVPGAGAARPADGMDPADDAALHDIQRLLSGSLSLAGGPAAVAARLRAALVRAQPALFAALPGGPDTHADQLARALTWLVDTMDSPPDMVAGCGRLGAALAECGVRPEQLRLVGAALAEAMRAGMPPGGWRRDYDEAWRTTWQHAYAWIEHGETLARHQPTAWTAAVISHEPRRDDLAVIRLRPFLPMPFRPGQYARIEVPELPGVWRPYSLAGVPRRDNLVELHVRAKTEAGVSGSLVYRTTVGDTVRIARAEGAMGVPDGSGRDLLMIAGDTGIAPLKAMLAELAATGDPRSAVLFWGVRTLEELYDIDALAAIARAARRATVVPVISEGESGQYASGLVTDAVAAYGEWSDHEVYLAGPPLMLAATRVALRQLGVRPEQIHNDAPEG